MFFSFRSGAECLKIPRTGRPGEFGVARSCITNGRIISVKLLHNWNLAWKTRKTRPWILEHGVFPTLKCQLLVGFSRLRQAAKLDLRQLWDPRVPTDGPRIAEIWTTTSHPLAAQSCPSRRRNFEMFLAAEELGSSGWWWLGVSMGISNRWFVRENPIKMDENWGYPYFRKPPYFLWLWIIQIILGFLGW